MLRMPLFTTRQKLGIFNLLLQREVYPWISLQIFPLVAFWIARGDVLDWFVPIFVATTIFTSTVGPGSVGFAYRQAHPDIKRHKAWFWQYLVFSTLVYTEAKNIIGRVAQLKQAMGETSWRVTPRSADPAPGFPRLPELKKTAELESDFDSPGVGSEQGSAPLAAVSEAAGAADL
jgi:hypothetical protein